MKDEAFKKLMGKAAEDLNLLKVGCENMGISDAIFGFHAQQTVEKIFKAWLCLNGKEYPFTHDLMPGRAKEQAEHLRAEGLKWENG